MWHPLFICGCPRSGTTALAKLLNTDNRIALGIERYHYKVLGSEFKLDYHHFEKQRFFLLKEYDTFWNNLLHLNHLENKFNNCIYRGDKIPRLYERLPFLYTQMPECKVLFIVRNIIDVAASYNVRSRDSNDRWLKSRDFRAAVNDWNRSLHSLAEAIQSGMDVHIIVYEDIFNCLDAFVGIYKFLSIDIYDEVLKYYNTYKSKYNQIKQDKKDRLSPNEIKHVLLHSDIDLYQSLMLSNTVDLE